MYIFDFQQVWNMYNTWVVAGDIKEIYGYQHYNAK